MGKRGPKQGEGGRPKGSGKKKETGPCQHKRTHTDTNRNGKEYKECDTCGAFLGWV